MAGASEGRWVTVHAWAAGLEDNRLVVAACKALEEEGLPPPKSCAANVRNEWSKGRGRVTVLEWEWAWLLLWYDVSEEAGFGEPEALLRRMNRGNLHSNSMSERDILHDIRAHLVPEIRICMAQADAWERKKHSDNMEQLD
jgi:hypothetical protein